jgi:HWE histidine kinase
LWGTREGHVCEMNLPFWRVLLIWRSMERDFKMSSKPLRCSSAIFVNPVRDESGTVVEHFASFVDITKQKQETAHSEMMIDELNHRVKNTLSTVQSIVWQALRKNAVPEAVRESIESPVFSPSPGHTTC